MSADKKHIVKAESLPGVDMSVMDLTSLASVKVVLTHVVSPLYKKGISGYISLAARLQPGEVIRVGDFGILYRIVAEARHPKKPDGGILHKVNRADGFSITSQDIDGIHKNQSVVIVSRRTFSQIFNQGTKPFFK